MYAGKRALITAIDSFTGRYLATELVNNGYEVFGTTRRTVDDTRHQTCDINDKARLTAILKSVKPEVIFHLAAFSFAQTKSAREVYTTNLLGTLSLLEAISESGIICQKILLTSSAHIYGNQLRSPITEDFLPVPASDYAISKLALENLATLWFSRLPLIVTRPFNFTGAGQSLNRLLPKIVDHFSRQTHEIELGNIETARDYSDVRDVVTSYRMLAECPHHSKIVNICSGVSYSTKTILSILVDISGIDIPVRVNRDLLRENDVNSLWGDNRLLKTLITQMPCRSIEETLRWMYETAIISTK